MSMDARDHDALVNVVNELGHVREDLGNVVKALERHDALHRELEQERADARVACANCRAELSASIASMSRWDKLIAALGSGVGLLGGWFGKDWVK